MTERLRVLRIIARMNVGGPARQVSALATKLDSTRFESRLLVGSVAPGETDYLELCATDVQAVQVPGLGRSPRPLDDIRALGSLVAEMHRFRPHIVHTHTAKAGALGRLAAVVGGVPARVHTFHGHLLHSYFSPAKTRAVRDAERLFARWTSRLVAVGAQVRDELLAAKIGRPQQYVVVPPGVDLRPLPQREEARRVLGLSPAMPVVAFVGRLIPVKRPDRFVDVAATLAARHPSIAFLVLGDGELRGDAEARARGLDRRICFLGWRSDIETIYAAADVVVLTSDNEGMPVSLIEAALAGLPAVTTGVGSAGEVVLDGVTGLVVAPSVDALAHAVERLLADNLLRDRMGTAAAQRAQREFSATRLIHDTERLYERIAIEVGVKVQ